MVAAPDDDAFMARALFWAERGRGTTSPNPSVGAVVVSRDGIVVGQGFTRPPGGPHAEIVAIDEAGTAANAATLYVTLEPCSHTGRTPPCVERIVAAGIRRVVLSVVDPNPLVSGRGVAFLQANGVEVLIGPGHAEAMVQHAPFFRWVTSRRPFVVAKAAVSADGFVGGGAAPVRLTGAEADRYFHRQRAEVDAVAVGSGTVLIDDPLLTPRGAYRHRPLIRVVIDWRGRVPPSARLFSTLQTGPVIMITTAETRRRLAAHYEVFERIGVEIAAFEDRDLRRALEYVGNRGVQTLLVEGGPALHTALADADLVDRLQEVVTPTVLGSGVRVSPVFTALERLDDARTRLLGVDRLTECDVHRTD